MSKITKSATKKPRRRRPNKKLVTTLDSLAAALPDEQSSQTGGPAGTEAVNIIRRKSIKSRPGAMKRREKLDQGERERFARNMAQMAVSTVPSSPQGGGAAQSEGVAAPATSQRWAALRGFIAQTLEQKPEVKPNIQR
ncbi:MAG: hypothetical protein AUG51_20535 [Acidobacteria bacterium 13_1_20CM_3_53_8]|nr:MAG: hypothetical protein AUG51_20535 [Acidobacteria bacterium 13_1_20CM_3_53_8]